VREVHRAVNVSQMMSKRKPQSASAPSAPFAPPRQAHQQSEGHGKGARPSPVKRKRPSIVDNVDLNPEGHVNSPSKQCCELSKAHSIDAKLHSDSNPAPTENQPAPAEAVAATAPPNHLPEPAPDKCAEPARAIEDDDHRSRAASEHRHPATRLAEALPAAEHQAANVFEYEGLHEVQTKAQKNYETGKVRHEAVLSEADEGAQYEDDVQVEGSDLEIEKWGLPDSVVRAYKNASAAKARLFKWQAACLKSKGVLKGGNLVFSAPTGSGKSVVGDVLAIRRLAPPSESSASGASEQRKTHKLAIMALPYVALCEERERHLACLLADSSIDVRGFYGPRGGRLPKGPSVLVCSYEKANSILVHLINESRQDELAFLLVDELHLVSDSSRGSTLEKLLAKALFVSKQRMSELPGETLQIVGMSATLPSISDLSRWLNASAYTCTFRPVPLQLYLKTHNALEDSSGKVVQCFNSTNSDNEIDQKHLSRLISVRTLMHFSQISRLHLDRIAQAYMRSYRRMLLKVMDLCSFSVVQRSTVRHSASR